MIYSTSSLLAAKLASENNLSPLVAWEKAVIKEFPNSISSQQKCCPRNTFLGLCEEGLIKGIDEGKYTSSIFNKQYGITAIKILTANKNKNYSSIELWKEVLKKSNADPLKRHNSQMNVVLALWNERFIKM